jgi:hypothetical protein
MRPCVRLKWRGLLDSAALYQSVLVSTDVHRNVNDVSGDSLSTHDELEFPLTFTLKTDSRG